MAVPLILVLMFAADLLWWWRASKHVRAHGTRVALHAFAGAMTASLLFLLIGRTIGVRSEALLPRFWIAAIFVWHLLGLPVAFLVGVPRSVVDAVRTRRARRTIEPDQGETPADLSRRAFMGRTATAIPVFASFAGAGVAMQQLNTFRIRRLEVPIRGLPSNLDGLTIAHVSDTHLGTFTTSDVFQRVVAATNDLDADLVCFTGDLINFDQRDLPVATALVREMRGRHGVYLCEGNHDLIQGRESFERYMRVQQMPILINESAVVRINGFDVELMGLPWSRVPRGASPDGAIAGSLAPLLARRQAGAFPILLAHHPHAFDAAIANGIPLTLSGHTHGGQLALSQSIGFGPLMYRYWSGLYERDGHACVVSNGVGNWFPVRVNAPAEIVHLTLRNA